LFIKVRTYHFEGRIEKIVNNLKEKQIFFKKIIHINSNMVMEIIKNDITLILKIGDFKIENEKKIMDILKNESNILQYIDFFKIENENCLIFEKLTCFIDIFSSLNQMDIKNYIKQLFISIKNLHKHNIIHCDIKVFFYFLNKKKKS
jgi:serine/threonine protein kinase